jgi:hypothetical protein
MEQTTSTKVKRCSNSSTSSCILHKSTRIVSNGAKEVPRVGNIWISSSAKSLDHFTRFFIPRIEVLFQSGDKILKVEAFGLSSRLVCWKLWQNVELQQAWQLDSSYAQTFSPLPIIFQDLIPVTEGDQ